MRSTNLALLVLLAGAVGCSSNASSHRPDAHVDGLTYDLSLDLPPGCPPAQANEKGVGAPCTRNGHQCGNGLICACDTTLGLTLNGVPCICTLAGLNPNSNIPCDNQPSNFCGTGATCCNFMKQAYFCSPDVCLPGGQCVQFVGPDGGTS
jgi:hypothetical protein